MFISGLVASLHSVSRNWITALEKKKKHGANQSENKANQIVCSWRKTGEVNSTYLCLCDSLCVSYLTIRSVYKLYTVFINVSAVKSTSCNLGQSCFWCKQPCWGEQLITLPSSQPTSFHYWSVNKMHANTQEEMKTSQAFISFRGILQLSNRSLHLGRIALIWW